MNTRSSITMKRIWMAAWITLVTLLPGLPALAQVQSSAPNQAMVASPQPGPIDPLEVEAFLDAYFAEQMADMHIPGVVFVLVRDGEISFAKGYGYADLENRISYDPDKTVFWAASVAKGFTAVGVLQLHDRGLIGLDSDVNQYLSLYFAP